MGAMASAVAAPPVVAVAPTSSPTVITPDSAAASAAAAKKSHAAKNLAQKKNAAKAKAASFEKTSKHKAPKPRHETKSSLLIQRFIGVPHENKPNPVFLRDKPTGGNAPKADTKGAQSIGHLIERSTNSTGYEAANEDEESEEILQKEGLPTTKMSEGTTNPVLSQGGSNSGQAAGKGEDTTQESVSRDERNDEWSPDQNYMDNIAYFLSRQRIEKGAVFDQDVLVENDAASTSARVASV